MKLLSRYFVPIVLTLGVLLLVGGVVFVKTMESRPVSPLHQPVPKAVGPHPRPATHHATPNPRTIGIDEMHPHANGTPLTVAEVVAYVKVHPFLADTKTPHPSSVRNAQALTGKAAAVKLHDAPFTADNEPTIYVELVGPFTLDDAPIPVGDAVPTVRGVYELFDAYSGNVLIWGVN